MSLDSSELSRLHRIALKPQARGVELVPTPTAGCALTRQARGPMPPQNTSAGRRLRRGRHAPSRRRLRQQRQRARVACAAHNVGGLASHDAEAACTARGQPYVQPVPCAAQRQACAPRTTPQRWNDACRIGTARRRANWFVAGVFCVVGAHRSRVRTGAYFL